MKFSGAFLKIVSILSLIAVSLLQAGESEETSKEGDFDWKRKINIGVDFSGGRGGDSFSTDLSGKLEGKSELKEIYFSVLYQYREAEDEEVRNKGNLGSKYNHFFKPEFYGYLDAQGSFDEVAGVNWRVIGGSGFGYRVIKTDTITFDAEGGFTYIKDDIDPDISSQDERNTVTMRIGEKLIAKVNEKLELWQKGEYLPEIDDMGNYIVRVEVGGSVPVYKCMKLGCKIGNEYDSTADEKNDSYATVMAIIEW